MLFNASLELSFVGQKLTDKLHPETSFILTTHEVDQLIYSHTTLSFP